MNLLFKYVLAIVILFSISNKGFGQSDFSLKEVNRLDSILSRNDVLTTKNLSEKFLLSLFENDTITATELSTQMFSESFISDTICNPLYTFILFQGEWEKINKDISEINIVNSKIETQKDSLAKQIKLVTEKTPIQTKPTKKKQKSIITVSDFPIQKDEIKTTTFTKLRFFDVQPYAYPIPETLTELEKQLLLNNMEEYSKDLRRTLDSNLKSQHRLIDIKKEMFEFLNDWSSILDSKTNEEIRYNPLSKQ